MVVHYSIYTISDAYLHPTWVQAIREAKTVRVMFIQDEYRQVNDFVQRMREMDVDILFTCVPFPEVTKVYPKEKLPRVRIFCTLTGFTPESLARTRPDFVSDRPIDVGYRARSIGYWFGELGQEKVRVASRFLKLTRGMGLNCDISTREEDRIYGSGWVRFLRSCRCVLGTESGASVFDFTGDIAHKTQEYVAENPGATFEETRERCFPDQDGRIRINQISPRVFESIACGACLVLFEGAYSGIIRPGEHFIPLRKDFSDLDEVVRKIKDKEYCRAMAERAYRDVVVPGRYSYRAFAEGFDRALEMAAARPRVGSTPLEPAIVAQEPPPPPREPSPAESAQPRERPALRAILARGYGQSRALCLRAAKLPQALLARLAHVAWKHYYRFRICAQPTYLRSFAGLVSHSLACSEKSCQRGGRNYQSDDGGGETKRVGGLAEVFERSLCRRIAEQAGAFMEKHDDFIGIFQGYVGQYGAGKLADLGERKVEAEDAGALIGV